MGLNKKGDGKYYILISLILGLMVLGISLTWIFQEFFNEDDLNFEVCRQSILLRATLPEYELAGLTLLSFKDEFPLKCKTSVVEIGEKDLPSAEKIIAREMAECWALFDNGDSSAFPNPNLLDLIDIKTSYSVCVPCSRIKLTSEAKQKMLDEKVIINMDEALNNKMNKDYNYFSYLNNSGRKFSAFVGGELEFDRNGEEGFSLEEVDSFVDHFASIESRLDGETISVIVPNKVILPELFDPNKGDLIISYGITSSISGYVPYIFYFQTGQEPEPFSESQKDFLWSTGLCETWEGIPA